MHSDIRCPACHSIDWWRDGFVIVEDDAGEVVAEQAAPAAGVGPAAWSCSSCAYEVPSWTRLAQALEAEHTAVAA